MDFEKLKNDLDSKIINTSTIQDIEDIRVEFLGKNGKITKVIKNINFSGLSTEQKKIIGSKINDLKLYANQVLEDRKTEIYNQKQSSKNIFDLTIPGMNRKLGKLHPIRIVQLEIENIFRGMGFRVITGFEVEKEYYNFDALNTPEDHPAREMQDTFWLENGDLLRTHTSANQVRALEKYGAPLRAIFPGRCFRYEKLDSSHENTFYQVEGLLVDKNITVANLIAVMKNILEQIFNQSVEIRLRPGYFPFVEPGFELDIQCSICSGKGCSTCKYTGWIELIPCGLVHKKVLEFGGLDPDQYSGFAFGCGLTRLAMMKFQIPDIRLFNCGDLRFYEQFTTQI